MLIHELLSKDPYIVPEETPLIILYSKYTVCMDKNGKDTKHITLGAQSWYIIGAYMPPNDVLALHQLEKALAEKPKGAEIIFLGDLNAVLEYPQDERKEGLATAIYGHGLEDFTRNFTLSRGCRERGR